jgi:hypothetical protein
MSLLAGGVADAGERIVESKLLEWFRSGAMPWCSGRDRLLLVCGGSDCCVFAEDGGGFDCLKGGMALTLDPVLKRLGGLLQPKFLIGLDPVLRSWWLSRLVNTSWLGASSAPKSGPTTGALLLLRRWRRACVLDSCGVGSLQQYNRSCPCVVLLVSALTLMNTSNVYLRAYIVKKKRCVPPTHGAWCEQRA